MTDRLDDQTPDQAGGAPPGLSPDAFSRRTLMASVIGGVSVVALASRFAGTLRGGSNPSGLAQTGSTGPTSIGEGSPSPVASPVASPVTTATPTPSPTPVPDPFGDIDVFQGDRWEYASAPVASETLTLFVQGTDNNLDFNPVSYRQDVQITTAYLDPLVGIDTVTMEPIPWLAEKWLWDDGNQTVTFSLRGDVTWHDGRRLTADDVAFSFLVYRDDLDSAVRNFFTSMESVEAVDDRTVRVDLTAPDGNWILNASSLPIFSERQYGDFWNGQTEGERTLAGFGWDDDNPPIGTGPWTVAELKSDDVVLHPYEDYWQEPPFFEKLVYRFTESQEDRVSRWIDGDADLLWPVSLTDIPTLKDTEARLFAAPGAQVAFTAFNFENWAREQFPQLLSDRRVREALNLAVDRDKYATENFLGLIDQRAAGTVAQPWANDPSVTNPRRDLGKAKQLLAEAGFLAGSDGMFNDPTGVPFTLTAIVRDDANPMLIDILNGMVEDFAELGATLTVNVLAPDAFFDTWANTRAWDLIAYSYGLYPGFTDYDLYGSNWDIRINPQGWNPGGYNNEEVDDLLKQILISPNLTSQANLLDRLQEIVNGEDLFGLWFGFPNDLVLARSAIQGYQPNKYLPVIDTRSLWRDEDGSGPIAPSPPVASPVASAVASPAASPMSFPIASPDAATPVP